MYNKDSVKLKKWLEWPFVITDQIARRKEHEEMIYLLGWSNFLQETWSKIRQYCRLLLHLSHFFVQIDFQTLFLFLHSRVFTYTPLRRRKPILPRCLGLSSSSQARGIPQGSNWGLGEQKFFHEGGGWRLAALLPDRYLDPYTQGEIKSSITFGWQKTMSW